MKILLLLALSAASLLAQPCIDGTPKCTEWLSFHGGPSRSMFYRTYPLTVKNTKIERAFVLVHGASRDADQYFRTAVSAAFLAGALEDTIVVAPRFGSNDRNCEDTLAKNEVNWTCSDDSWRAGGTSVSDKKVTSYDFADEILKKLADKSVFPNLKQIVLAGHSAGGQFVTRYEMANKVHDSLGVPVLYVVSNPSSYAWLDTTRPEGYTDGRNCTTYNKWPYGLDARTGYTAQIADDVLKKQLAQRSVVYLLGEIDILPLGGFDGSCPAMAQGPTRRARGEAFAKYVNEHYSAKHETKIVHLCGHNARCMFTAEDALPVVFPKVK